MGAGASLCRNAFVILVLCRNSFVAPVGVAGGQIAIPIPWIRVSAADRDPARKPLSTGGDFKPGRNDSVQGAEPV